MTVTVVLGHGDSGLASSLAFAGKAAQKLGQTLHGLAAMPDPDDALLLAGSGFFLSAGALASEAIRKSQEEALAAMRQTFADAARAAGLPDDRAAFQHVADVSDRAACFAAVLADAIVFPRGAGLSGHALSYAFERVVMGRRLCAVLAPSDDWTGADAAIIAWDGSPEAARSVMGHATLLKAFPKVVIATNPDAIDRVRVGEAGRPERVRDWLAARGVASEIATFDGDVAEALLALAATHRAGVLVAGAFGHSRAEELVFGGATRSLLHASHAPAMALAH